MKVTIKIFFLLLAISLAIGGVMVYAKTKVEPPMTIKQVDQYAEDIATSRKALVSVKNEVMEDSIFFTAIDRINVFNLENKIQSDRSDKYLSVTNTLLSLNTGSTSLINSLFNILIFIYYYTICCEK